jgi:uncharacterized membrane protein YbhN (UPF0104 family)
MVKNKIFLFAKIAISVAAIYFVFSRVKLPEIAEVLMASNKYYLLLALTAYVFSKLVSAARTRTMLDAYNIPLSGRQNLRVYWTGMFYNLFLPGGIGGDIYRTIVINLAHSGGFRLSTLIVLMDRIAGVAVIMITGLACLAFTSLGQEMSWFIWTGIPTTILFFVVFSLIALPALKRELGSIFIRSIIVQGCQIIALLLILASLDIYSGYPEFIVLFLASSIAAMLPVSVGGIGIREMVFLAGSSYLHLDQGTSVSISFAFYMISVIASLPGLFSQIEGKEILGGKNMPKLST